MRPRIKSYVYFDQHPEGVFFRSGGEAFILRGRGIYPIVAKLVERLDGQSDLQLLSNSLPEPLRPLLAAIVSELAKRSFLVDCSDGDLEADLHGPLNPHEVQVLAYLADHVGHPVRAFVHWRDRDIVLVGDGRIAAAAREALVQLGARKIASVPDLAALQPGPALDGPDAALLVAIDVASEADNAAINLLAPSTLVAGQSGGSVVVVPAAQLAHVPRKGGADAVTPADPQCALAGKLLAHELFIRETGIADAVVRASGKHILPSLRVVDFALDPAEAVKDVRAATDRPLSDFEKFWATLDPLFQEPTGLFRLNALPETSQLPLFHRQISLSRGESQSVRGWGLGFEDASRRALRQAVEAHTALSVEGPAVTLAGFSREEAEARRELILALSDPGQHARAEVLRVEAKDLEGDALVLYRLCQKLGAEPFAIVMRIWPQLAGAVVEVAVDGKVIASAAEADRGAAIVEVLGAFCSNLQNDEPPEDSIGAFRGRTPHMVQCADDRSLASFGLFVAAAQVQREAVL